jgi:putative flippase GtrA
MKLEILQYKYIIFGLVNTIFGYIFPNFLYYYFISNTEMYVILLVSNIVTHTFSFFNFKLFVYKTKSNYLIEYTKSIFNNLFGIAISIIIMYILVDYAKIEFWKSQILITAPLIIINYYMNTYFVFKTINYKN